MSHLAPAGFAVDFSFCFSGSAPSSAPAEAKPLECFAEPFASKAHIFDPKPLFPCRQIVLMGTPVLTEDNVLRSSNVAMFQEHPCAQEPCHNGGQCNPHLDTYECVCLSGFSGGHCQSSESAASLILDI